MTERSAVNGTSFAPALKSSTSLFPGIVKAFLRTLLRQLHALMMARQACLKAGGNLAGCPMKQRYNRYHFAEYHRRRQTEATGQVGVTGAGK
jgi:hypothetical protein